MRPKLLGHLGRARNMEQYWAKRTWELCRKQMVGVSLASTGFNGDKQGFVDISDRKTGFSHPSLQGVQQKNFGEDQNKANV